MANPQEREIGRSERKPCRSVALYAIRYQTQARTLKWATSGFSRARRAVNPTVVNPGAARFQRGTAVPGGPAQSAYLEEGRKPRHRRSHARVWGSYPSDSDCRTGRGVCSPPDRYRNSLADPSREDGGIIAFVSLAARPDQPLAVAALVEPRWKKPRRHPDR